MPIYEYKCDKCGHRFDILIKTINRLDEKWMEAECPECGNIADYITSRVNFNSYTLQKQREGA